MKLLAAKSVTITVEDCEKYIFPVLGEQYWNDTENIICIPVTDLTREEIDNLYKVGFDFDYIRSMNVNYIICELREKNRPFTF